MNHKDDYIQWIKVQLDDEPVTVTEEEQCENTPLPSAKKRVARDIFSYVAVVAGAVFIWLVVSNFVLFNAKIPSASMSPALNVSDRLFGFRLAYLFSEPDRGDVVIFNHRCYENEEKELMIKRIIGLPGETVEINDGKLYIDGKLYEESYIKEEMLEDFEACKIPEGSYFVMGDNRNISDDSRSWDYKYITKDEILAKAWIKYRPEISVIS